MGSNPATPTSLTSANAVPAGSGRRRELKGDLGPAVLAFDAGKRRP
ncbi:MAG: hypothetical protein QOE59_1580, partial [Actinomycetota bacterium]|nr:hypothetical protein [Actinomycetota bacterium]